MKLLLCLEGLAFCDVGTRLFHALSLTRRDVRAIVLFDNHPQDVLRLVVRELAAFDKAPNPLAHTVLVVRLLRHFDVTGARLAALFDGSVFVEQGIQIEVGSRIPKIVLAAFRVESLTVRNQLLVVVERDVVSRAELSLRGEEVIHGRIVSAVCSRLPARVIYILIYDTVISTSFCPFRYGSCLKPVRLIIVRLPYAHRAHLVSDVVRHPDFVPVLLIVLVADNVHVVRVRVELVRAARLYVLHGRVTALEIWHQLFLDVVTNVLDFVDDVNILEHPLRVIINRVRDEVCDGINTVFAYGISEPLDELVLAHAGHSVKESCVLVGHSVYGLTNGGVGRL